MTILTLCCVSITLVGEWEERYDAEMDLSLAVLGNGEPLTPLHPQESGVEHALFVDLASLDDVDGVIYQL
jgi:hypothetical protein